MILRQRPIFNFFFFFSLTVSRSLIQSSSEFFLEADWEEKLITGVNMLGKRKQGCNYDRNSVTSEEWYSQLENHHNLYWIRRLQWERRTRTCHRFPVWVYCWRFIYRSDPWLCRGEFRFRHFELKVLTQNPCGNVSKDRRQKRGIHACRKHKGDPDWREIGEPASRRVVDVLGLEGVTWKERSRICVLVVVVVVVFPSQRNGVPAIPLKMWFWSKKGWSKLEVWLWVLTMCGESLKLRDGTRWSGDVRPEQWVHVAWGGGAEGRGPPLCLRGPRLIRSGRDGENLGGSTDRVKARVLSRCPQPIAGN